MDSTDSTNAGTTPAPDPIPRLQAAATRVETPCGDGATVWHRWGKDDGASGPPVVLLHGGSGSWTHWVRNIDALVEAGREVWVPDLPGFGDSDKPPGGGDADAVAPAIESGLMQLLDDRPCDLVGFSFGGMTAGLLAAAYPTRAARLVLVGAPALGVATKRSVVLRPWRHLRDEAEREAVHRYNLTVLMLYRPEAIDELALWLHKANVVRDRLQRRRLAYTEVLIDALMKMRCPVHAIYGREDVLYRDRNDRLADTLHRAPTFKKLSLIDEAGHWVQFERAHAFDTALLAALAA